MDITYSEYVDTIKIYINNVLHIRFKRGEFVSLQSWAYNAGYYAIEIVFNSNTMTLEYDNRVLWEKILSVLDKIQGL